MTSNAEQLARRSLLGLLLAAAGATLVCAGYFGHSLLAEAAIFAIFAMSVDLLAGFAGLVSLGQALYFALGAYATALLYARLGVPPLPALLAAMLLGAAAAGVAGALALRLRGVFFLMVTLAFAEMFHAFAIGSRFLGGSDGITGVPRPAFAVPALGLSDSAAFALYTVVLALGTYLLLRRLVRSPFGAALGAIRLNEARIEALGAGVFRLKLAAQVLAGALGAMAGSLMAQLTGFVSPELAHWSMSGQVLIMAILGGLGSLAGPAAGAAALVLGAHYLSNLTSHWMLILGGLLVAAVLFAERGMFGALVHMARPALARQRPSNA